MVKSKPAVTPTGEVIERVSATSPARAPLSAKMKVRTAAGLIPTSRAPTSSWMTERAARPSVVARKNRNRAAPTASEMAEAHRLPGREGDRHHHRRQHGRLAVGQVEDASQPVDQGHADAQQPELEAEDDPVQDDGPHATPR